MTRGHIASMVVVCRSVMRGRLRTCIIISMRGRIRVVSVRVRAMLVHIDIGMGMFGSRMSLDRSTRIVVGVRGVYYDKSQFVLRYHGCATVRSHSVTCEHSCYTLTSHSHKPS